MQRALLAALVVVPLACLLLLVARRDPAEPNAPAGIADGGPPAADTAVGESTGEDELDRLAAGSAAPARHEREEAAAPKPSADALDLVEAASVRGRVVPTDGAPVDAPARVRVRWMRVSRAKYGEGAGEAFGDVAADGAFEVRIPKAARTLRVDLQSDFLALERGLRRPRPGKDPLVLEATRGGCLLVEFTGPAAEAASAEALDPDRFLLSASSTQGETTHARRAFRGEDGALRFGGLPPDGAWTVGLDAADYVDASVEAPAVPMLEYASCMLEVSRGCGVTGVVVDDEGTPMAGVPLKLFTWHRPDMRYDRGREVTGQSAEDGSFSLRGVLPGEAGVNANPEDALPRRVDLGVLADGDLVEDLELRLDRGGVLTGVVVWADGEPANGVDVYVAPADRRGVEAARDRTDREGRFEASGLRGDAYVVTAVGQRNRRGPFLRDSVRTGRSGRLELKLGDGLAVRGRAVDDAGAPLRDLRVVAQPLDEPGEPLRRRFRDDGGVFEFTGLGPGRWDVSVHAEDHGSSLPRRVTLPGASDALEFVLLRHGSLGGTVKGTDGAPVAGARVAIGALRTETGPEGRFAFDSLPPGQHVLDVTAAGYGPPADPHVRVVPGAPEEDHVVLLTRGGRILGRIHPDRWTGKETGVLLRVAGAFAVEAAPVDQEGRFRFEGLAGGSYLVRLDGSNADHWADRFTESLEVPVEVPENGDVRVVLGEPGAYGVTVHGTVRRGGEPTAGLLMYVYKTDEEVAMPRQITRTDEQGRYEVSFRQTGLHSFCVGEGQAKQARFDVVLTDEARQSHDFDMPERSLRGQVRLVGGAPAGGQQLMLTHADVPSDAVMVGHTAFTYTGADGTFEFTDLHPGAYRLRTGNYVRGHATRGLVVVEDVVVPEEGDAAELDLFLPEAASVDARAVDAAGRGLVDRRVELLDPNGRHAVLKSRERTDSQGRIRIPGLGPGRWEVVVRDRSGAVVGRGEVETSEGAQTSVTVVCG